MEYIDLVDVRNSVAQELDVHLVVGIHRLSGINPDDTLMELSYVVPVNGMGKRQRNRCLDG